MWSLCWSPVTAGICIAPQNLPRCQNLQPAPIFLFSIPWLEKLEKFKFEKRYYIIRRLQRMKEPG